MSNGRTDGLTFLEPEEHDDIMTLDWQAEQEEKDEVSVEEARSQEEVLDQIALEMAQAYEERTLELMYQSLGEQHVGQG